MIIDIKAPQMGESIVEVQIGAWLKAEGDFVQADEALVEMESDKASMEFPSPVTGRLVAILKRTGETARIDEVIARIEEDARVASAADQKKPAPEKTALPEKIAPRAVAPPPAAEKTVAPTTATSSRGAAPVSPVDDAPSDAVAPQRQPGPTPADREEIVPMSLLRRRVAERLVEAQRTMALLSTFNEIDMSAVMNLRATNQEAFQSRYGVKLGLMSFFVKAVIDALKRHPRVNAEVRGDEIVYHKHYDLGVAVGTERGLVVPVIRNADALSFAEVEKSILDLATRAREKKITVEELSGGTFTITNGGVYGSLLSTPIVNPPQSAILGMHTIKKRPVVVDDAIVIRPMMYVALTYDHRLIDGVEAVGFLNRVKDVIEQPSLMLVEI